MALLSFTAADVAAQIAHARGCSTFLPNWNGPVGNPALILIVGNGACAALRRSRHIGKAHPSLRQAVLR